MAAYIRLLVPDDGIVASDTVNGSNSDDSTQVVYNNYHTTFDPYVDELPFQNFESEYGVSGNCTGIAHLTSYLFIPALIHPAEAIMALLGI